MPGRREPETAVGHSFGLELDGVRVAALSEVSGLGWTRDVIEVRDGADPDGGTRHLPGRLRANEVTLTRALGSDLTFDQWMREPTPSAGRPRRRVSLVVLDRAGRAVARFDLENAWPSRLEVVTTHTAGGELLSERLTLVSEGIERV